MNILFKGPLVISKSDYSSTLPSSSREIEVIAANPTEVKIHAARRKTQTGVDFSWLNYSITVFDKAGTELASLDKETKLSRDEFTRHEIENHNGDAVKEMQNRINEIVFNAAKDDNPVNLNLNSILDRYI